MTEEPKRVVSLAPSATATLIEAGVEEALVGVTAHCDADAPAVGGWLNPDYDRVAALDPDLVFTVDDLQADVRDDLRERGFDVHHEAPRTLAGVVASLGSTARAAGRPAAGARLVRAARRRVGVVRRRVRGRRRPTVYCEEWSDPPMAAGNWVPEAVVAAGGAYPFVPPGERSREVTREAVVGANPDHVVLHVCGRGDRVDPATVRERGWGLDDVPVHVVDDDLLNQPGPRLVDGVQRLAALLHPDAVRID